MSAYKNSEINHLTIKLIIGIMAISLALVTSWFADTPIQSISASYHEGGWARDVFVGFLFAISAFLFAYNGNSRKEKVISKVAAVAGMGVAMFPCKCENQVERIPLIHGVSAAVMFLILAFFCYTFYRRARDKDGPRARRRVRIYLTCFFAIVASIAVLALDQFSGGAISAKINRLTFYGESVGLIAFGISWLTASRCLPLITTKEERFRLW